MQLSAALMTQFPVVSKMVVGPGECKISVSVSTVTSSF